VSINMLITSLSTSR